MRLIKHMSIGLALVAASTAYAQDGPPKAVVNEVTDTYFGQKIVDPYRWMEDSKNGDFVAWMKAQAGYTRAYLDRLPMGTRNEVLPRVRLCFFFAIPVASLSRRAHPPARVW